MSEEAIGTQIGEPLGEEREAAGVLPDDEGMPSPGAVEAATRAEGAQADPDLDDG